MKAIVLYFSMIAAAFAQSISTTSPDLLVAPVTGGYTINTRLPIVDQSTAGGPILSAALDYAVKVGGFFYTIPTAGSSGFAANWSTMLVNVSQGPAAISVSSGSFEGAGGTSRIVLNPGDWVALTVDGANYLAIGGHSLSAPATSPALSKSAAPGGGVLINSYGVWSWGPAGSGRPGEYRVYLNGADSSGVGSLIEVSTSGQLFCNTISAGWWVYGTGGWSASGAPK